MITEKQIPISKACLGLEVSKSGYYDWTHRKPPANTNDELIKEIQGIAFEFPGYGYRRITAELHRRGAEVNHKRILKIMREEKLLCRRKKKHRPVTTQSNHGLPVYPNLSKDLKVTGLNQLWVSDITYIHLPHEFIYLAAIIDLFSRKCIGWSLSRTIDTQLTLTALNMAISARRLRDLFGLIHHSDRGVQYASQEYVDRLLQVGMLISMSRKGNVYDNAFAESFLKTFKVEEVYINEYNTISEAYENIKHFIEEMYNRKRLHSSIGYMPPEEFESKIKQEVLNSCTV